MIKQIYQQVNIKIVHLKVKFRTIDTTKKLSQQILT
jgi:hypothetical protein